MDCPTTSNNSQISNLNNEFEPTNLDTIVSKSKKHKKRNKTDDSNQGKKKDKTKKDDGLGESNTKGKKNLDDKAENNGRKNLFMAKLGKMKNEEFKAKFNRDELEREKRLVNFLFPDNIDDYDQIELKNMEENLEKIVTKLKECTGNKINKDHEDDMDLLSKRDWLRYKLLDFESEIVVIGRRFEPLTIMQIAVQRAVSCVTRTPVDNSKLRKFRNGIQNINSDIFETNNIVEEIHIMAFILIPKNVSAHCRKIYSTNKRLKELQETYKLQSHFTNQEMISNNNESLALREAIIGEKTLKFIVTRQSEKLLSKKKELEKQIQMHQTYINECNVKLDILEATKEEAEAMAVDIFKQNQRGEEATKEKFQKIRTKNMQTVKQQSQNIKEWIMKKRNMAQKIENIMKTARFVEMDIEQLQEEQLNTKEIQEVKAALKSLQKNRQKISDLLRIVKTSKIQYFNEVEDLKIAIRIFCRVRPLNYEEKELDEQICLKFPDVNTLHVKEEGLSHHLKEFIFDRVFEMKSTQFDIFKECSSLIDTVFHGFNVCFIAYGATGNGKTYSLFGDMNNDKEMGIMPRIFNRVFEIISTNKNNYATKSTIYMLELHNDKLLDLLKKDSIFNGNLEIHRNEHGLTIVPNCTNAPLNNAKELFSLYLNGMENRLAVSKKMNATSIRSHLILAVHFKFKYKEGKEIQSKIIICDLASSEIMQNGMVKNVNVVESPFISKDFTALGDVLCALTMSNRGYVPYRHNKLTMLMHDSLNSNSKTVMFVNVSPANCRIQETIRTLNYGTMAKTILKENLKITTDI